jgi:hypothetical protein
MNGIQSPPGSHSPPGKREPAERPLTGVQPVEVAVGSAIAGSNFGRAERDWRGVSIRGFSQDLNLEGLG